MATNAPIIGLLIAVTVGIPTLEAQGVLFNYGDQHGDASWPLINIVGDEAHRTLDVAFNFYGKKYTQIAVSMHGHIAFGNTPMLVKKHVLPYEHVPSEGKMDRAMASVYFAKASGLSATGETVEHIPRVFYRTVVRTDTDYPEILKELGHQVRINSVNDMSRFWPKRAVIATWHNVRPEGCTEVSCPRNTYQAAIMTDDTWTYAIYNYQNLTWRGGKLEDCDNNGGGALCFSAQVGFNAGEGREFTALPTSGTDQVLSLVNNQGSKTKGRYIYQVSHGMIIRDGCSSFASTLVDGKALSVYPSEVLMFGGTEIHIAGPCLLDPMETIECKIENDIGEAKVLDSGRIACVTPLYYGIGEQNLMIRYKSQAYSTKIKIALPQRIWTPVKLEDYSTSWLLRKPEQLKLSWEPTLLNGIYVEPDGSHNTTNPDPPPVGEVLVKQVKVALFGYGVKNTEPGSETPVWKWLKDLHTTQDNSGMFSFNSADHQCTAGSEDCAWQIGAIKIVPSDHESANSRGIFSDLFPMGWWVEADMSGKHGEEWPDKLCQQWQDGAESEWEKDLIQCPCTRGQAYADIGLFIVDANCDGSGPCPFHKDANICFLSRTPTTRGGQTRCCYKNIEGQEHGVLIFSSAVQTGGSFSSAAHIDGISPYKLPSKHYPLFSHWIMDKLPMVWCCVWSFDKDLCITHYEPKRRTPQCRGGQTTQSAFAFGDPHFQTFDGTLYTFNGYSEYWLLRVDNLEEPHNFRLQARMENYIGTLPVDLNATVITAVAMQQGTDKIAFPKISLHLNPPLALNRISVYVDGIFQEFYSVDSVGIRDKDDTNIVYITRNSDATWCNNFTVAFSNGASVNVAEDAGMLQVKATAPPSFFKHTSGLFGFWDGDKSNDLRTRDGQVHVNPNNSREVHEKFGADWALQDGETVFAYFKGQTWLTYQKKSFVPMYEPFIAPGSNLTMDKVDQKCQNDKFCRFDYMATLDEAVATASLSAQSWANQVKAMTIKVPACPNLNVHLSKRGADSGNLVGGKVTLASCVSGNTLVGAQSFECVAQGGGAAWAPAPQATICKSNQQIAAEQQQTAVAIAVPITLVLLVLLISIAAFMIFKRKQANESKPKSTLPPEDLPRQEPPINPNPSLYTYPEANLSLSKTSVSSKVSRGSNNSIVLDQVIHAQRPPRPVKTKPIDGELQPDRYYANVPGEYDNQSYNTENGQERYIERAATPQFQAPPPPTGAYDNRGSDVPSDSPQDNQAAGAKGGNTFV